MLPYFKKGIGYMWSRSYTRRAKLTHYCCWCGAQIWQGDIYTDTVFLCGGFVEHHRRHSSPDCPPDPDEDWEEKTEPGTVQEADFSVASIAA